MKDLIIDANFPRTADQRVYHLGLRAGEIANRIITVGSPSRAEGIALQLDASPSPFTLSSERGFLTITGRYKGVPVSIISIGMGGPNMDFFVREVRESLRGDMIVIRLGSCGSLVDIPVGSVVVPQSSVAVTRNYDFDFGIGQSPELPYHISKPAHADPELYTALVNTLESQPPSSLNTHIVGGTFNASADSFYSSQGRQTSFPDHNNHLIDHLMGSIENLATLEMETFHLFHLAASWRKHSHPTEMTTLPPTHMPVSPSISPSSPSSHMQHFARADLSMSTPHPRIRAAAAHMVFASRLSQAFITPEQVLQLEEWCGHAVLETLCGFHIDPEHLHDEEESVWETTKPVDG